MGLFDHHAPKVKAEVLPPAKEQELIFHDSVPIEEEQLPQAREKAAKQKGIVLDFFRQRFSMSFTPAEVHSMLVGEEAQTPGIHTRFILLTSVRRSITNLTKAERLIKCQWSERKEGRYGKPNRTWRYNRNFINPLNSQPHFKNPKNFYEKMNP